MHVIVVGAGAAGLAAAWRLREAGVEVTLVEMADHVGGRCHAVHWHGDWRITGAFAFTTVEENLIEQARKLGIYDPAELLDLSGAHTHDILMHGDRVISLKDFEPSTILGCGAVPWREKLALAKALPRLAKQMLTSDWRDPTPTSVYDTETAEAYFRPGAPVFIDYLLEPIMQHFNGFAHDDLSIAWLLWILGGRPWSRSWWSFQERGVGRLTHAMGERLVEDGMRLLLNARVGRVGHAADGVKVDARIEGAPQTLTGDAVVCAVPGSLVNQLVPDLAEDYRAFFSSVQYGALYLSYYLVELPAELSPAELPEALILPTVDGFHNAAYFYVQPLASRQAIVHVEMKGAASAAARDQSEEQVRTALWTDVVTAAPRMAQCRIEDFLLIRNDLAIMKPYVGYIEALRRFRALPPLQNIAFAGDYLLTSTVGQAHYSGLQAAESLLR